MKTGANIIKDRIELYKDFTINLLFFIYKTYLGKEFIKNDTDIRGHFNWAYKKVLDEFEQEEISFYDNNDLYNYFYSYYLDQFYNRKEPYSLSFYENFWNNIFELKKNKNKKIFEILIEVYEIFDKSINIKENKVNIPAEII